MGGVVDLSEAEIYYVVQYHNSTQYFDIFIYCEALSGLFNKTYGVNIQTRKGDSRLLIGSNGASYSYAITMDDEVMNLWNNYTDHSCRLCNIHPADPSIITAEPTKVNLPIVGIFYKKE